MKFTAYAAVTTGKSVCQGYATLFYRLAKMQGISSRVIAGHGTNTDVYHGWNIVKLGNLYYNVDATWDATNYKLGHPYEYFLKGDGLKTIHELMITRQRNFMPLTLWQQMIM